MSRICFIKVVNNYEKYELLWRKLLKTWDEHLELKLYDFTGVTEEVVGASPAVFKVC